MEQATHDWQTLEHRRGVTLRTSGTGRPLFVFAGMEGSGESCLHLTLPVIGEAGHTGQSHQVFLLDYAAEKHDTFEALCDTLVELVDATEAREAVFWAQSFGNLLALSAAQQADVEVTRMVLVSPFTRLPALRARLGALVLQFTPPFLYQQTAGPMGHYLFGPAGDRPDHPFFASLKDSSPSAFARRTRWLQDRDFSELFRTLSTPARLWLGARDRLVDLDQQLAFFTELARRRPNLDVHTLPGAGHVVLDSTATRRARDEMRDWLLAS